MVVWPICCGGLLFSNSTKTEVGKKKQLRSKRALKSRMINVKKAKKSISRETGLEIASICGKYFLNLESLHYGYWTGELEVNIANLRTAQEEYTKFLISHIPAGVKTILDVGCGTGQIAKRLLDMGCDVDCVSPSGFLTEQTRELLGDRTNIYQCRYEQLQTEKRYDLILFAESFQYIGLEQGLKNTVRLLNNDSYMLICDVFKKGIKGNMGLGGGCKLNKFYDLIAKRPFRLVKDLDITKETAPNIDILDDATKNVGRPVVHSALHLFSNRHPIAFKLLEWKYRKKLNKLNDKYFGADRTGENFKKFKSYRLFLYRKTT